MVNFLVVGWGTAQISNPALILNKAANKQRAYDFGCIARLKRTSLKILRYILPNYLKSLYKYMLRLIEVVIDAQGGHTKY